MKLKEMLHFETKDGFEVEIGFNQDWRFTKRVRIGNAPWTRWSPVLRGYLVDEQRPNARKLLEKMRDEFAKQHRGLKQ